MRIITVSTADRAGGAEKVAYELFDQYRRLGHQSRLIVGVKFTDDPDIVQLKTKVSDQGLWERSWINLGRKISRSLGSRAVVHPVQSFTNNIARLRYLIAKELGVEYFDFGGTRRLLNLFPASPEIVHCHNLHNGGFFPTTGGFFNLRLLPWLSQQVPIVLTLHDAWLLSGHCAHSLNCERWKTGCGHCPDLSVYPAVKRDATAYNWNRKRQTYVSSHLYVATPSRWLMHKVEQSILAPAIVKSRIIPYGIDLSIFKPSDKSAARDKLGLPQGMPILLFTATSIRRNVWKDYEMMRKAVALVAEKMGKEILFVALGDDAPDEQIGSAQIRFIPHQNNPQVVAQYYQAADIYLHAARADTFPNVVLEALACGTPVVATAVGGIPEQINDLYGDQNNRATGVLVPVGDAPAMADAVIRLLEAPELRLRIAAHAAEEAHQRFDIERHADDYLKWYSEILEDFAFRQAGTNRDSDQRH